MSFIMIERITAEQALGLEIEGTTLLAAELLFKNGKPSLGKLFTEDVKQLYNEELTNLCKTSIVVTALNTSDVLVRPLEINLTKEKDIDSVLEFQVEPQLPYPIEESLIDRIFLEKQEEYTLLSVISTKKEFVSKHLEQWNNIHCLPEVIGSTPTALAAFSFYFCPQEEPLIIIHLTDESTTCVLVTQGNLVSAQSIPGNSLLEISRVLLSLEKLSKEHSVSRVLLTGPNSELEGLRATIETKLNKTLITPTPTPEFQINPSRLQQFAIPIGSALTCLPGAKNQINFRQKEFLFPDPWKRIKTPLALYIFLCILLSIMIYLFGNAYAEKKEDNLREDYVQLLALMKKPYSSFEKHYATLSQTEEIKNPKELSTDDIINRLNLIEKENKSSPDTYALLPNTPRVSDVLAWLNTLPVVTGEKDDEKTDNNEPRFQITSFNYKMVKRPEQNKKNEKYQVKIEIEFITSTPRIAREFHDLLLAPNDFIDPKGDVSWSTERGKYRASFYLKDSTNYPKMR